MNIRIIVAAFGTMLLLVSCGVSKKAHQERLYLQGIDSTLAKDVAFPEPLIQKGDLLTIMVYSDNKDASDIYNQQQTGGSANANMNAGNTSNLPATGRGYQVDRNGMIYFHGLGDIKVEGKTKQEVAEMLKHSLDTLLRNPYAVVRFTNKKITVVGEVASPGMINLPDQQVSILDAIGLSGDLTVFGRRDNILVVREENGVRTTGRIDLRSPDIYKSPYFFLKQNDLVYVEPNRRKSAGNDQIFVRNVSIAASLLSVVTVAITLLTR
ncbi:polysaccharide biosynthesis/export family protein [Parasegetibacter sp. NRK P23]|uniref:polysaccharide biosynthesis/export family protein n=1 Tax=Parasegetibacter sp. NRK P23 TaxID=2942999 RepID=UPI002044695B|nr:polysaccharide biosynthesis/export family protein [Parasegetibacter sp. NRK P23]MCM5527642.1 polysaccharide biosynthesis/export family protein [Parasegetibacter sp. NRK P23]